MMFYQPQIGRRLSRNRQSGFTMIEIIATLIIMGILAGFVASHATDSNADLVAARAIIKGHLRYAQMKAMNSDNSWGIAVSSSSITLQENGSTSSIPLPATGSSSYSLPSGVSLASTTSPITFDQRGSPGASTITLTLTQGSNSTTITVTRNTGFID